MRIAGFDRMKVRTKREKVGSVDKGGMRNEYRL